LRPDRKFTRNFFRYLQVADIAVSWMFLCPPGFAQSTAAPASDHMGKVVARVRDGVNEELLPQVLVQLIHFPDGIVGEQFTGSDGSVQFSGLPVGAFTIRASRQDYEPGDAHVDLGSGDRTLQNVDILLKPREQERTGPPDGIVSAASLKIPDNARKEFAQGSRLLNEKKDFVRSIAAFRRAIELYPGYAEAYFLLGSAQLQTKATAAAEASLRKAIALDAHMTAAYYPLAVLLFGERRYSEERELLLEAQKLDASDWRWPFELARCHAQQGQWDIALSFGLAASESAHVPPKVHLLLADIYANANKPREAIAELELFAKLDPSSAYMDRVREVLPILRQRSAASTLPSSDPR
jgi:Tetratricopeptide repeat